MKQSALSGVISIILASIFFCPIVMATPPMPNDVEMVEPDPSLPREIAGFWGKWEGEDQYMQYFVIVEKIDGEKASIYRWRSGKPSVGIPEGWDRFEAKVIKEYGKHKLWWWATGSPVNTGNVELTLKGKYMDYFYSTIVTGSFRLRRVP